MSKLKYFLAAMLILLFVPVMVLCCAAQEEEPVPPENPAVGETVPPEETTPTDPPEKNGVRETAIHLVPEKKSTIMIEGKEEEITLRLHESSLFPYAIYLDKERYVMEVREGKDYILTRAEGMGPEVYMAIRYEKDANISELFKEIESYLGGKYAEVNSEGWVESPLAAQYLYAIEGNDWDDSVERFYLLEGFNDGVFIIQQKLFLEAMEGHGVRFDGILEEFYMLDI